ncbi:MAG: hypothetical protein JNM66_13070 [Bryobacterales bacterium]|nr:hypothetical protein [Bryobacterales bacterium]
MKIHWARAIAGALAAEIGQVAAAFVWVAIYSHLINPGQPMAVYNAHAQASGPWVSIFAGAPIFYAASRWIAKSKPAALALFAVFLFIDLALLTGMTDDWTGVPYLLFGVSYLTKLGACALGGRDSTVI